MLRHVAERCPEHGLEGSRLAVAGDSAGANIAAAVTLLAKERSMPAIRRTGALLPHHRFGVRDAFLSAVRHRVSPPT